MLLNHNGCYQVPLQLKLYTIFPISNIESLVLTCSLPQNEGRKYKKTFGFFFDLYFAVS